MNLESPWKHIKAGFWFGMGFIPIFFIGAFVIDKTTGFISSAGEYTANSDQTNIKIVEYKDLRNGDELLILGSITNTGESSLSLISLEAELFDQRGEFVYECSEYVKKRMNPGEKENFQINCGSKETPIPEYKTINLRVVHASSY